MLRFRIQVVVSSCNCCTSVGLTVLTRTPRMITQNSTSAVRESRKIRSDLVAVETKFELAMAYENNQLRRNKCGNKGL